jgi:phosphoenolpyruvate carboxylase
MEKKLVSTVNRFKAEPYRLTFAGIHSRIKDEKFGINKNTGMFHVKKKSQNVKCDFLNDIFKCFKQ